MSTDGKRISTLDWLPAELRRRARVRDLASGELLFSQSDPAVAIFLVESGRLRLMRRTLDDHLVNLHTATVGELFAEAALFSDRYHCDAVAVVASRVRAIPKAAMRTAMRANVKLFEAFAARLAGQLQAVRARLELRNIRSARDRLLQYLALAAGPDGRSVNLDGSLQDMAANIGVTREAFYRTMAALEAQGMIARESGKIVLKKRTTA